MDLKSGENLQSDRITKAVLEPLVLQPYRLARKLGDKFIQSDIRSLHRNQSRRIVEELDDFDSLLDVGSGFGYLGDALQEEKPDARIASTDVINVHKGTSEFRLGDGTSLPFDSNSFDVVTFLYVLHHMKEPRAALQEALRVSRKRVMIHEDTPSNAFQRLAEWIHIYTWQSEWPLADIKTRSDAEWQKLFQEVGFVITSRRRIKMLKLLPLRRYQYILEKSEL